LENIGYETLCQDLVSPSTPLHETG
jgi:hypothetical protein